MFTDPEDAYRVSEKYAEELAKKAIEMAKAQSQNDEEVDSNGSTIDNSDKE
jgi:hypothetical protein